MGYTLGIVVHFTNVNGGITSETATVQVPFWAKLVASGYVNAIVAETYRGKRGLTWGLAPLGVAVA